MTKPIPDKAEIALEYPDKVYVGTFEHTSRFEAHLDPTGFSLILERLGDEDVRKSVHMHINFGLFASILGDLASTVRRIPKDNILHRDQLAQATAELHRALIQVQRCGATGGLAGPSKVKRCTRSRAQRRDNVRAKDRHLVTFR